LGYYTGKGLAQKWPEPMKMEQTECSETSAYKIQTPGYHPKESIQHSQHGESLKSRSLFPLCQSTAALPLEKYVLKNQFKVMTQAICFKSVSST